MRILLVNDAATPSGGAELMTFALKNLFVERGHDARILASSAKYGPGKSQADYTCFGTVSRARTLNQVANPSAYRLLKSVLDEFRPDVVHVRMFLSQLSPLILPLLQAVPTIYHATWYETICPTGFKTLPDHSQCVEPAGLACHRNGCLSWRSWPFLMLQLELWRRWRHAIDRIVANSEALAATLRAYGVEPVEVIWNGVPVREQRAPLSSPPTIAYAGRLSHEKGVDVLVRAFRQVATHVPDARLVLAGTGDRREDLESLVIDLDLGSHVEWLGHVERSKLERELSSAWVQVLPSLVPETFGLAAAEAMMRGTAVVASDIGGIPEIVANEQTGLLVPAGDPQSLAAALIRLVTDRLQCEQMGCAGRQWALDHLTEEECAESFIEVYNSICRIRQ